MCERTVPLFTHAKAYFKKETNAKKRGRDFRKEGVGKRCRRRKGGGGGGRGWGRWEEEKEKVGEEM
jgi:hypothetical protein